MENPIDPDWPRAKNLYEVHSSFLRARMKRAPKTWQDILEYNKLAWFEYVKKNPEMTPQKYVTELSELYQ